MRNSAALDMIDVLQRSAVPFSREAIEQRWSRTALRAAVRSGKVLRVLPGTYAAEEHSESLFTRAHAATAWVGPGAVLIGTGAAAVWGMCDAPTAAIRVSADYGTHRAGPDWLRVSRMRQHPPSADWHQCAVANPAWAAVTSYAEGARSSRDRVIDRAVQQGHASPHELVAVTNSLDRIPGRRHLMSVIGAASAGAESHLETVALRRVFSTQEFSAFVRQHRVRANGSSYRLDMYHPATRIAVELDGAESHSAASQRLHDVERDAQLASVGITTIRFTYGDVVSRGSWCREIVRSALAARGDAAEK